MYRWRFPVFCEAKRPVFFWAFSISHRVTFLSFIIGRTEGRDNSVKHSIIISLWRKVDSSPNDTNFLRKEAFYSTESKLIQELQIFHVLFACNWKAMMRSCWSGLGRTRIRNIRLKADSCHGRNFSQPYFFKRNQSSDNRSHGLAPNFY